MAFEYTDLTEETYFRKAGVAAGCGFLVLSLKMCLMIFAVDGSWLLEIGDFPSNSACTTLASCFPNSTLQKNPCYLVKCNRYLS